MKLLKLFTALLIVFLLFGCKIFRCQTRAENKDVWVNPQLNCHIPEVADDFFIEKGKSELKGKAGIKDFCARMQEYFAESGMTPEEARKVYDMLLESGMLQDESFGMPSPDDPPARITDFSTRAALLKSDENNYEIFIIITGGGKTYMHAAFSWPDRPTDLQLFPIEVWRASYPW
jgi:hypothetical protein